MGNEYQYQSIQSDVICFHHTECIKKTHAFRPYHRHNAYELLLFVRGNVNFYLDEYCYPLTPGDLVIANTHELHRNMTLDESPYERYGINVKPLLVEHLSTHKTNLSECFESVGHNHVIHLNDEDVTTFIDHFNRIEELLYHPNYAQDVLLHSEVANLLVFLNKKCHSASEQPKNIIPSLVRDTMTYIQKNLTESISLSDLEKKFLYNGSYISQQFKNYTGLTIRDYILEQRISLAKTLLLQGKNVTEACIASGFSNYSNFIRSFTNKTGITPGKYRKLMYNYSHQR